MLRPPIVTSSIAVLGFILLATPFQLQPTSTPYACGRSPDIAAPTFKVERDTTFLFVKDTVLESPRIEIEGQLLTANATTGNAPGLCIVTESLTLRHRALLCTGQGRDGNSIFDYVAATGTPGTDGGLLQIHIQDDPRTKDLPALRIDAQAKLCSGPGGDGGNGVVLPDCLPVPFVGAQGGPGGDAGGLEITYTGPRTNLALAKDTLHVGKGGDGGAAVAIATHADHTTRAGNGGRSIATLTGFPSELLESALDGGEGGTGGTAFSAIGPCEPYCKASVPECLQDCMRPARLDCFMANAGSGRDGDVDEKHAANATTQGTKGIDGNDAQPEPNYGCPATYATRGHEGGPGAQAPFVNATGGHGGWGSLKGGNGGNGVARGGTGGQGGTGGTGGDGLNVDFCGRDCESGGPGGIGGLSSSGEAKGGNGGDSANAGGNGGMGIVVRGNGGTGGTGGDGGHKGSTQCSGGCGGPGGVVVEMEANPGHAGVGWVVSGIPGETSYGGPAVDSHGPPGSSGKMVPCT